MRYWIAVAGTAERPLDNHWRSQQARWEGNQGNVQMFRSRPRIQVGDRLVMYASGSPGRFGARRFFAVREVVSEPEPSGHERWPWKLSVRIGQELATGGGPPTDAQAAEMQQLGAKLTLIGRIDLVLLTVAVVAMATARYV